MEDNDINKQKEKIRSNLKKIGFYNSNSFHEDKDTYINNLINRICVCYGLFSIENINCSSPAMIIALTQSFSSENNSSFEKWRENQFKSSKNSVSSECEIYDGSIVEKDEFLDNENENMYIEEEDSFHSINTCDSTGEAIKDEEDSAISKVYLAIKEIDYDKKTQIDIFNEFITYLRNNK